jgi:hypothetical protein
VEEEMKRLREESLG